ncbi:MAG: endonuclease/exonuclease/phosphatase family protein [Planctomycetota bacterium]
MSARRALRVGLWAGFLLALAGLVGFAWNGMRTAWTVSEFGALAPAERCGPRLRVLAFNIAKASFYRGGVRLAPRAAVEQRLARIAAMVREQRADLVFLSEVVWDSGPQRLNQVRVLAERTGLHAFAYGDNYRFGLPFFQIRAGNAILSRFPLRPVAVEQLAGGAPFYAPTNNRRILWCDVELGARTVRIAAVRNDSFDLENNARQAQQILATLGATPALLAGDFNAEPKDAAMRLFETSGLFLPLGEAPPTFPADEPTRRIDFVLAPVRWRRIERRTLPPLDSDHLAVLAEFELSR